MEGDRKSRNNSVIGYVVFAILAIGVIAFGVYSLITNLDSETYTFDQNGYAVVLTGNEENAVETYSFVNGEEYSYKKYDDAVSFGTNRIDDTAVLHYSDGSLLALKNMVGMDLSLIDNEIIPYYNIFKNTKIDYTNGVYSIETSNGETVTFNNLLLRIDDEKFLLASSDTRMALGATDTISYGDYAYFEYDAGSVAKIYNDEEYYQTISNDAIMVTSDISIELGNEEIKKEGISYISLTNLVMNQDGNIDLITDNTVDVSEESGIAVTDVDVSGSAGDSGSGSSTVVDGSTGDGGSGGTQQTETVVDEENVSEIKYKVTKLDLSALKADVVIEIEDEDSLLTSATTTKIVENSTYSTKCEYTGNLGDVKIEMSCLTLAPDTEYTLYASATYKIEDVEYDKTFVAKIFRTEALGVTLTEEYTTTSSVVMQVEKESYSKINSVTVNLYSSDGNSAGEETVVFTADEPTAEITFDELDNNTTYTATMSKILSEGVIVDDGYTVSTDVTTLKEAPVVNDLSFEVDKKNSTFTLNVESVSDSDYGIVGYEFMIYDTRYNMDSTDPVYSISTDKHTNIVVNVDDVTLMRNVTYTYRLKTIFYDGEKYIEYVKDLGQTMQVEGVDFPTLRWEETYVTWEQINGAIIVNDPSSAVVGNEYTIIYKNSADVHRTVQLEADATTGNIPIAINGLRKNETYTFQVYADINLQDGNPTIDNAYLGSIFVQTGSPNTMSGKYEDSEDYTKAFAFNFSLESLENEDASFEASTLTGMTFSIYAGTDPSNSQRVAVKKVVDTNTDEYESTLKTQFFDDTQEITPAFFDMVDSDFTEKNYTLVVSYAYDYTEYPNELPLTNATYTFATSIFIPDYGDALDAINVTPVLNAAASKNGLSYNSNLDATTVVGYSISAKFDNSSQLGKYVVYHVWKLGADGSYTELTDLAQTVFFDINGNLPAYVYPVGDGTSANTDDTDMLRRGNTYKFSYEAYLDLRGTELVLYPAVLNPDVVLYSQSKAASKQAPKFSLYPSSSANNVMVWKYKYKDYDLAISDEQRVLYTFNGSPNSKTNTVAIDQPSLTYNTVSFESMDAGSYGIGCTYSLLKTASNDVALSMQYYPSPNGAPNLNFHTWIEDGQVVVGVVDSQLYQDELSRISTVDITLTPIGSSTVSPKTLSGLLIENGNVRIDFYDITEFLGVDFSTSMTVYYDSNIIGYDVSTGNYMKLLQVASLEGFGEYLCFTGSKLEKQSSAWSCNSNISLIFPATTTSFTTDATLRVTNNEARNYNTTVTIDESGVSYGTTFGVTPKLLATQSLSYATDETNSARFDQIVPGISMLENTKVNITPLINSAVVKPSVKYLDASLIQNGLVYYEILKTDSNGANGVFYRNGSISAANFGNAWSLTNLTPNSNYSIKFYVMLWNSTTNSYEKQYLYDVDFGVSGYSYRFYTMSNVGVGNIKLTLNSESYYVRSLDLSYTLELTTGFDYIDYEVYRLVDDEYVATNISYPRSTSFSSKMTLNYANTPVEGSEIAWGETYKIVISPVGHYDDDEGTHIVDLGSTEKIYTLPEYTEPYVGFSGGKGSSGTYLYWRVSIKDQDHVISGDEYEFKVLDNTTYNTIYTQSNISTATLNKYFTLNQTTYGLVDGRTYTGVLTLNYDTHNSGTDLTVVSKTKDIIFGDQIDVGSVTITAGAGNTLKYVFANSFHLTDVTHISYGITKASTGELVDSVTRATFTLNYVEDGDFYYYDVLVNDENELFEAGNVYLMTMSFYQNNLLVDSEEVSYYYEETE